MKEILKLSLSLMLICAMAGAALAWVNLKTEKPIKESKQRQLTQMMKLVLPDGVAQTVEFMKSDAVTLYSAQDEKGEVMAFCADSADPSGFGGAVKVLVGLNLQGDITGVLVYEHSETPGIGTRPCNREAVKSIWDLFSSKEDSSEGQLVPNRYLDSYSNNSAVNTESFEFADAVAPGKVVPESGATVSSTAVKNAVNRVLAFCGENRQIFK